MTKFTTGFVIDIEDPILDCSSILELQAMLEKKRPKVLKLYGDWQGLNGLPEHSTSSIECLCVDFHAELPRVFISSWPTLGFRILAVALLTIPNPLLKK